VRSRPEISGAVSGLWRYPVKSMLGEKLDEVLVNERGAAGDREWALIDPQGKLASDKDSRRFRRAEGMMLHRARLAGDGVEIELADGTKVRGDEAGAPAAIERAIGPGWTLAREDGTAHFDASPIHLITEATLRRLSRETGAEVEPERTRPNILLSVPGGPDFPEDRWVGLTLALGEIELRVVERTERCVMTTQAQRDLPRRPEILKTIGSAKRSLRGGLCRGDARGCRPHRRPAQPDRRLSR